MKKIYTSIDIGSDTIKFVVAEKQKNNVNVLAAHEEKSKGTAWFSDFKLEKHKCAGE